MKPRLFPALAILIALAAVPVHAVGNNTNDSDALRDASNNINAGRYQVAINDLKTLLRDDPRNADILNLLGYASRKSGNLDDAATWYQAALEVNPNHRGALEYQGEMFIILGDMTAAQANLARLVSICGACEEQQDLAEALAAAGS